MLWVVPFVGFGVVAACGGSSDDGIGDGSIDVTTDPVNDVAADVRVDAQQDVSVDVGNDVFDAQGNDANEAGVDVIVDAPVDSPPETGMADAGCASNADCMSGDFCQKADGDCGGIGACMAIPFACPLVIAPVCGCDKKTYNNSCYANKASESVAYKGACE
jgi:hypothetical protein